jgi:ribosomal protein S27AE
MPELAFSPLENGLDYLQSVVDGLAGDPTKRDLKYAVLHLSAGIEVLAKYRLHREHWTLVLSKPDDSKVNLAAFERGDFQSISGETALTRLRNLVGLPLTDDDLASVRAAQRQRNKLQHFGLEASAEAIESVAVKALDFILGFLDDHVAPDADPADALLLEETMPKVREQLGQIRTLVQHRMDRLTPQLAHLLVVQCPRCAQTAFVPDHLPRCAYCGETWADARTAAEEYASVVLGLSWYDVKDGGERPVEDCPECGGTTIVWDFFLGQDRQRIALCFECSGSFDDQCSRCSIPMLSPSDGSVPICPDCWADILSRD